MSRRRGNGEGTITERADGRWMGRILVDGQRITVYGKTQKEAVTKLNRVRSGESPNRPAVRPRPTSTTSGTEWLARWRENLLPASELRTATIVNYATLCRVHLEAAPELAQPIDQVRPSDVVMMLGRMKRTHSQSTVRAIYAVADKAFRAAMADGLVEVNVVAAVERPKPGKARHALLDEDKIGIALAQLPERFEAPIRVVLATGMRRGEVAGLQWGDVDLDTGQVTICRSLNEQTGVPLYYGPTKTDQVRTVVVPASVLVLLRTQRAKVAQAALARGWALTSETAVFAQFDGRPYAPKTIYRAWSAACKTAGMGDTRLHALRHRAAHQMQKAGVTAKTASLIIGHADPATTMRIYTASDSVEQTDALRRLDAINAMVV